MTALTISHLTHRYGKTLALDDLSLTLPRGLTVGLIGPDGVGKSTLLGLIAGVRAIQHGELHVLGGDMRQPADRLALSHRIAYMPQGLGRNLYPTLSVYENIDFHARLFGLPAGERRARIRRLLDATGLAPFPDRATGKLSGGMKQKASLCCALVHSPDLLILDEPTTGVDPLSRRQFWALVRDLQRETAGMTVLVATAYIEEAEPFAQLWAMDAGKLLVNAPTREVMAGHADLEEAYIRLLPPEKQQGTGGLDLTPFVPDPSLPPAIEAHHLTKRFGDFTSVDDVSFTIQQGEIFGFLGSNGCGKSTTMKMLTGLLQATSGTAELLGAPVDAGSVATRMRVGYMSQAFSLYEELTVRQNLTLHARLYRLGARGKAAIRDALTQFDLADVADVKPAALPLGIRQRLQLAAACLHRPEVLILDEPTSGVDPAARDMFWRHLLRMSREDKITIFVTTHFMNEAARCDRISFMHQGRVLAVGTPAELVAQYQAPNLEEAFVQYLLLDEAAQKHASAGTEFLPAPTPTLPHGGGSLSVEESPAVAESPAITIDNTSAAAQSPAVLPPPSQRSAAGEGWGGGSARIPASDVETSSDTTADESPTAPASPAILPPSPCGGGDGGGVRPHTADVHSSTDVGRPFMADIENVGHKCPTYDTADETLTSVPRVTPPQPSPTGGGSLSVEEGASGSPNSDGEPPAITIDNTPTAPASPAILPPPSQRSAAGEGWGGGSVRISSADVETSSTTTANEPPTAAPSPTELPPPPVGEGWGGGSKKSSVASFMSAETASTTEEGLGGGSDRVSATEAETTSQETPAETTPRVPLVTPPQPSPTGGGGLTVEESASAKAAATLPPPQPSPAADAGASCEGGGYSAEELIAADEPPTTISDTPTTAQTPADLPPPPQRSAAGEGRGGGSAHISTADVETSSTTTANEPPTVAQSPTVLPPPPVGEGWGGGSKPTSVASFLNDAISVPETSSAEATATLPPPPPSPAADAGASCEGGSYSFLPWLATIRTFAIREGKELLRDHVRTFFALFGPVILMTAVTWGVSFDVGNLAFAVRDRDQSAESRAIVEYFAGSSQFHPLPPLTADADIDTALESSSAKMIIDIPPSFGRDLLRGARPEIGFYLDGAESFNAASLTGYIASILGDYARDQARAHGIALPPDAAQLVPRFRYNPDFKSILAIAPGVLMLALSLFPAMMAAVGVVREREIGSIANFYASPASRLQFLLGKQLPYLAAAMLSFLILYLMMRYWFGVPLNGSAAALLSGTLLMCATTTATGLLVSCFTRSQVAAIFITAVGTVMPAMSFSGFLVPVSSLQGGAYIMGKILPSAWYANLTTGTFTKGLGYPELMREHLILGSYYLLLLALATANLKKQER